MGSSRVACLRNAGQAQGEHVGRGGRADGHRVQAHQLQHAARLRVDHGVHGEAVGGAIALGGHVQSRGRDALAVQRQHEAAGHRLPGGNVHCVHDQVCSAPQNLNALVGRIEVAGIDEGRGQRNRVPAGQLHRRCTREGRAGMARVAALVAAVAAAVVAGIAAAAGSAQRGAAVAVVASAAGACAAAGVASVASTVVAATGIAAAVVVAGAAGAGVEGEAPVDAGSAAVEGAGDAAQRAEAIAAGAHGGAGIAAAVVAGIAIVAAGAAAMAAAAGGTGMMNRHGDSLLSVWKRGASMGFTASYARAKNEVQGRFPARKNPGSQL